MLPRASTLTVSRSRRAEAYWTVAGVALLAAAVHAESPPAAALTLDQAVDFALLHHPALRAEAAIEEGRRAQVAVARTGYLPSVDLSLQLNVGTGNVLRGG